MIADATFLWHLLQRQAAAMELLASRRSEVIRTCIIAAGEIVPLFSSNEEAWNWLQRWRIYRLHDGIVSAAADVDRELFQAGGRLGENDNWIAGFARYYREPLISRDAAFDRVGGLRRLHY
jgi:predicted nucleic acid-binding protein